MIFGFNFPKLTTKSVEREALILLLYSEGTRRDWFHRTSFRAPAFLSLFVRQRGGTTFRRFYVNVAAHLYLL
jgi:hypothetical protein